MDGAGGLGPGGAGVVAAAGGAQERHAEHTGHGGATGGEETEHCVIPSGIVQAVTEVVGVGSEVLMSVRSWVAR